jgi:hypothetical protein
MIRTFMLLNSQGSDSRSHPQTGDEGVVGGDCPGGSSISQPAVLRPSDTNLLPRTPGVLPDLFPNVSLPDSTGASYP